jgi:hypothetical protein
MVAKSPIDQNRRRGTPDGLLVKVPRAAWAVRQSSGREVALNPGRNLMKRFLVCSALLAAAGTVFAQGGNPASPPDTATGTVGGKTVTITYSSPRVKGREGHVFTKDGLIAKAGGSQYPIWRAGANAATTLKTDGDLMIGDIHVPAGTYTLFVDITDADNWVFIVNKQTGQWGLRHDAAQDLGKTKMQMSKPGSMVEELKYTIAGGKLTLAWENKEASVPIAAH